MEKFVTIEDIQQMEKRHRANLINSLPGFKSASLIGTVNKQGQTNLAIFSSLIHLGANPALMGFIMRPVSVPRHTYQNIKEIKYYTVNHVNAHIFKQAHQTSARYEEEVSEFDATGLKMEFLNDFPAPYVKDSHIKLGLEYVEEYPIQANGTILIVGRILEARFPTQAYREDGYVDPEAAETIAISGLDSYHQTNRLSRLRYAKPGREPKSLE